MKHFFVDTNVLFDLLGQREPFGAAAAQLVEFAVRKKVVLYIAALSFSHIAYSVAQNAGYPRAAL